MELAFVACLGSSSQPSASPPPFIFTSCDRLGWQAGSEERVHVGGPGAAQLRDPGGRPGGWQAQWPARKAMWQSGRPRWQAGWQAQEVASRPMTQAGRPWGQPSKRS